MKSQSELSLEHEDLVSDSQDGGLITVDSADFLLNKALSELDALFVKEGPKGDKTFKYLLCLWSSFSIYQLEPNLPSEASDEEGTGTAGSSENVPQIIRLKEGWKVLDFGDGLITSVGKNYGGYSTGPLLKTINYMIDCLIERGAKKVMFSGSVPAKRFAWLRCKQAGIKTHFSPSDKDYKCQENIERIQKNSHLPIFSI
ncbi:hypothetical protein RVIR1_11380 [Candidatus Rickettsiella viridis]|uniref:Uncharacterized protein n=1 Tax=Candidatus Rickettsiella viridis TaxID=676208 RepID=A0A2Z5V5A7_9COXI|nr:hypothetical protein [Candidatus Rickettsiella viridis]BBB15602.1 hypothetical protein RVIR1_11380 [Candidatus Rickettsiella viridis]